MLCSVWSEESQKVNRILFFYWQQLNNRILASINIIEGLTHIEQPWHFCCRQSLLVSLNSTGNECLPGGAVAQGVQLVTHCWGRAAVSLPHQFIAYRVDHCHQEFVRTSAQWARIRLAYIVYILYTDGHMESELIELIQYSGSWSSSLQMRAINRRKISHIAAD